MGYADRAGHRRRRDPRVGADAARRDGGQRRPADDGRRPGCVAGAAAVDHQRLPPLARLADPARRRAGRPARPAAGLRHRHGLVRPGLAAVRCRAQRRDPHRGAGAAGHRRRAADPGEPGDDPGRLPLRGPQPRDRGVVRPRWDRRGARSAGGRSARRPRLLAVDLPDQPPARGAHRVARDDDGCPRPGTRARTPASTSPAPRSRRSPSPASPGRSPTRAAARRGGPSPSGWGPRSPSSSSSGGPGSRWCRSASSPTAPSARPTR